MSQRFWVQFSDARQTEEFQVEDASVDDNGHLIAYLTNGGTRGYAGGRWQYFELDPES